MTDQQALVRAIGASPDDDAPRLVYADWLEEHGQPERAEFIRLQCELAGLKVYDDYRRARMKRSIALFQEFGPAWLASDWPEATRQGVDPYTFDRGFVVVLAMANRPLNEVAFLRMVRDRPLLGLVHSWNLSATGLGDEDMRSLADSPYVRQLRALLIPGNPITAVGLEALASSPNLAALRELHIGRAAAGIGPNLFPLMGPPYPEFGSGFAIGGVPIHGVIDVAALFRHHGKEVTVRP